MSTIAGQLSERIRSEITMLQNVVTQILTGWKKVNRMPDEPAYLDSVALNLHGFYAGVERLFELIARHIDGALPDGAMWHRDLLYRMTQDVQKIRPAVISDETAEQLDALRRFRHLVRNVYTMSLDPEKMVDLVEGLPILWPKLRAELMAFADFLERVDA
jgi:hypothetical protein